MEKMEKGVVDLEPLAPAAKGAQAAGIGAQYAGMGVGIGAGCAGLGALLKAVGKVWRPYVIFIHASL